ncbi:MAG: glycosyltransferase 87 family protein [Chitinophagaceae bacterium]
MEKFSGAAPLIHPERNATGKVLSSKGMTALSFISLVGYFLLAYKIDRTQTIFLYLTFAALFFIYGWLLEFNFSKKQLYYLLFAALCFRAVFLFSIPHLSDDYFRFIWDGRLSAHGINPFNVLPLHFYQTHEALHAGVSGSIYEGLNSKNYYTIYPPVMQGIFWLAAKLFPQNITGSLVVMRVFIILAESGTIFLIRRLLIHWKKNENLSLLYAWNPLVIAELSGNLHFEAIMIFFLLLAVYLLVKQKEGWSGLAFGMAVATKLLPLILLPALIRRIGWKKTLGIGIISLGVIAILFLPFMDAVFFKNVSSSIELYFHKFEFNAGLFYVIRWLGFQIKGYDVIHTVTKWLALLVLLGIILYIWKEKKPEVQNIFRAWMWIWLIYLACSTIVHPWYVTPLIAFAVFSGYRFPVVWSGVIILSYYAYRQAPYHESMVLVALEYGTVIAMMLWEFNKTKDKKNNHQSRTNAV